MWRAFFLAIGITLCILGGECLIIDKAVLARPAATEVANSDLAAPPATSGGELEPPEWAPWSLLSAGAVVILYSFTIPRRVAG
jgi:hypothetical protein